MLPKRLKLPQKSYNHWRAEPPKRPYKNLEDCRMYQARYTKHASDSQFWACLHCSGNGRIYDPDDPPCPVEGNKMRNRIKCQFCDATGRGTRKLMLEAYNASIKKWKEDLAKWEAMVIAWNTIKLTPEQAEAIAWFGVPKQ